MGETASHEKTKTGQRGSLEHFLRFNNLKKQKQKEVQYGVKGQHQPLITYIDFTQSAESAQLSE